MRTLLTFISLIAAIMTFAQTTQTGIVQEYNERSKKTPLAGVELNVRSAGNTVSNNKGEFSLQFLTLKPGEKVNVRRIEKLGYEIFNKEAVEQWNINPKTPFIIIMCKSDRFKRIRDNYEKVSSESYARQLKKEEAALAKLKEEGKLKEIEYEQKLIALRENYDKQLDNLDNYIDRFARIDLSELSIIEQEIIDLVQHGYFEKAIQKYEEQNFVEKYTNEALQLKEVTAAIDQLSDIKSSKENSLNNLIEVINRQIETLKLAGGKENYSKVLKIYTDLDNSDSMLPETALEYLRFLVSQSMFNEAIIVGEKYLSKYENSQYYDKVAISLGNAYTQNGAYNQAINIYLKCLEAQKKLSGSLKVLTINKLYSNLGVVYQKLSDFEKSKEYYNLIDYHNSEDPEFSISLCKTLINHAIPSYKSGNYEESDSLLNKGRHMLSQLDDISDRDDYLFVKANLYQTYGNSKADRKDFISARENYGKSLDILSILYERNPEEYIIPLARINYNYGRTYFTQQDSLTKAIGFYENSFNLSYKSVSKRFNQTELNDIAGTFSHLVRIYTDLGLTEKAEELCQRAISLIPSDSVMTNLYGTLLEVIGSYYIGSKKYSESEYYLKKAIESLTRMNLIYPGVYNSDLGRNYSNLSLLYSKTSNSEGVASNIEKSVYYYSLDSENMLRQPYLKSALWTGVLLLFETPKYDIALKFLKQLQEMEPNTLNYYETECLIYAINNLTDEAKQAFKKLLSRFPDYSKDSELYKNLYSE